MYKLSVIVMEDKINKNKYKTLDSLLNQTLKDMEILYTTDLEGNETKELAEYILKNNIKEKNNVNEAIASATGEYTVIANSNVFFEKNWAQKLYDYAKIDNEDMIVCDIDIEDYQENKLKSYSFESIEKDKNMIAYLNWNLCNLLFKTEKIKDIKLKNNNKYNELLFILEAMLKCSKIGYAQDVRCYMYMKETELTDIELKDIEELKDILKEAKQIYKTNNKYNISNKNLFSAIAFSKLGVDLLNKIYAKQEFNININEMIRNIINYLDVNFFEWRNNPILRNATTKKEYTYIWYANKMYRYGYMNLYLKLHKFMSKR